MDVKLIAAFASLWVLLGISAVQAETAADGSVLTKATISIKGSDLIIGTNEYTGTPDEFGGFEVAIKLPQKNIIAKNCTTDGMSVSLSVMMGDVTPRDPANPSPQDKKLIEEKTEYYKKLMRLSKTDSLINISVKGSRTYLEKRGDFLVFPYCSTEFSGFGE